VLNAKHEVVALRRTQLGPVSKKWPDRSFFESAVSPAGPPLSAGARALVGASRRAVSRSRRGITAESEGRRIVCCVLGRLLTSSMNLGVAMSWLRSLERLTRQRTRVTARLSMNVLYCSAAFFSRHGDRAGADSCVRIASLYRFGRSADLLGLVEVL